MRCWHTTSMAVSVTIRNVPQQVRDELAARAARTGKSLQEYLLGEITEMASQPELHELILHARERVDTTGSRLNAAAILDHLDEDRR